MAEPGNFILNVSMAGLRRTSTASPPTAALSQAEFGSIFVGRSTDFLSIIINKVSIRQDFTLDAAVIPGDLQPVEIQGDDAHMSIGTRDRTRDTTVARPRRTRRRSRISDQRSKDLIGAAIRSIAALGYNAVTVQSICEEAGFSRGLIGHYFAGKDELLLEAARQVADELGDAMRAAIAEAGSDPCDRLHAVVAASFTPPGFTVEKASVWVAFSGAARWSPSLSEIYRDVWREYRQGIARLMARAAERRGLDIDAESSALMYTQMVEGFWLGSTVDPAAITPDAAEAACHAFLDLLLRQPQKISGTA